MANWPVHSVISMQVTTSNGTTAACSWPSLGSRPLWSCVYVWMFYMCMLNAALSFPQFIFSLLTGRRDFITGRQRMAALFDVHIIRGNRPSAEQLTVVNLTTENWSFRLLISSFAALCMCLSETGMIIALSYPRDRPLFHSWHWKCLYWCRETSYRLLNPGSMCCRRLQHPWLNDTPIWFTHSRWMKDVSPCLFSHIFSWRLPPPLGRSQDFLRLLSRLYNSESKQGTDTYHSLPTHTCTQITIYSSVNTQSDCLCEGVCGHESNWECLHCEFLIFPAVDSCIETICHTKTFFMSHFLWALCHCLAGPLRSQ